MTIDLSQALYPISGESGSWGSSKLFGKFFGICKLKLGLLERHFRLACADGLSNMFD
jgi:hypothetical protein